MSYLWLGLALSATYDPT